MFRIDDPSAASVLPIPEAAGTEGYFTEGNPGVTPATLVRSAFLNMVQEELRAVVVAGGLVPSKTSYNQVMTAIKSMIDAQSGNYSLDTGAANAYVIATDPPVSAPVDGMTVRFRAANQNTGASTLNAGWGVVALRNDADGALAAADLPGGSIVVATYVAALGRFLINSLVPSQALTQTAADARYVQRTLEASITGACRSLVGSAAGGTKTASWTADQLVAMTALSGSPIVGTGLALAFNGAVTGAGGMDTGATPVSSNLYIYAIYKAGTGWSTVGTIAGSGAQIYGGANMPSGYTHSCLIWSGVTDASAFIRIFHQQDRIISGIPQGVLSNATGVTSFTSQSVSLVVPPNAKTVTGYCALTTAANRNMVIAGDAAGVGYRRVSISSAGSMDGFAGGASYMNVPLITSQTIYWKSEAADAGLYNLIVTDYSI